MAKIILQVDASIESARTSINKLKDVVTALADAFNKLKANKEVTEQIRALAEYNKSLAAAVEKTTKVNNQNAIANEKLAQAQAKTATQTAKAAEAEARATTAKIKSADATGKLHITEERLEQQQIKTAEAARKQADATKKATEETDKQDVKARGLVDTLMQWSVTSRLLYSGLRLLRNSIKDINDTLADTEKRVIAIKRVLPEGSVADQDLANRLYDLAIEYGQTFENVSEIVTNFARTGLSYAETIDATRAALLALNVAELDSTQATEGMIAIMAQFSLSASQMEEVVDKLNKTADRFPVTTEKLMTALQRMGSAAANAGLNLDESIGIVTALSQATGRAGTNLGTSLNSLIQYSKKEKALNIYAGLSDDMAEIVRQYKMGAANILDVWRGLSVEINRLTGDQQEKLAQLADYFATGEGSGLKDELEAELGDIFNKVNGIYSTANTFRQNYFISLIKNLDTVEKATETAREAQGYSIKENEKEMQTYERRVTALQEHWHKLANDEQGWLAFRKGLVEIGDTLLSIMEWTGGLRTAVIALGTVITLAFGQKVITMISAVITSMRSLTAATENATIATEGLSTAWQGAVGIIGLFITAASALAGAIEHYESEQHDANLTTIEAWNKNKDNAEQLRILYKEYQKLDVETTSYKNTEEEIISLLGDKTKALEGLTKGTDEYRQAIISLTESEINESLMRTSNAARAAKDELSKKNYFDYSGIGDYADVQRDLALLGYTIDGTPGSTDRAFSSLFASRGKSTLQYNIDTYNAISTAREKLIEAAKVDLRTGKITATEFNNRLNSRLMTKFDEYLSSSKTTIDDFFETTVAAYIQTFLAATDLTDLTDNNDVVRAKKYVKSTFYKSFNLDESGYITDQLVAQVDKWAQVYQSLAGSSDKTGGSNDKAKNLEETYADLADTFDSLAAKGKEQNKILDKQNAIAEKENELEQKNADILEAQNDLSKTIAEEKAKYVNDTLSQEITSIEEQNTLLTKQKTIEEKKNELAKKQNELLEAQLKYNEAIAQAKTDYVLNVLDEYKKSVEDTNNLFERQNKLLEAEKNLTEAITKARNDYVLKTLNTYLDSLEVSNEREEKEQNIEEARAKVDEARLKVEEKRQALKEAEYDLQKAQDDLEYARNNRNVRVFNKATGMWENQANQKDVQSAQEKIRQATENVESATKSVEAAVKDVETAENNVESAVENLNKYLQDSAIEDITNAITEGRISGEEVEGIFNKWFGQGGAGEWGDGVKNVIAQAILDAQKEAENDTNVISARNALENADNAYSSYIDNKLYDAFENLLNEKQMSGELPTQSEIQALLNEYEALGASNKALVGVYKAGKSVKEAELYDYSTVDGVKRAQESLNSARHAVYTARTSVGDAEDALTKHLRDKVISELSGKIKSGDYSASTIDAIIKKWFGDTGAGEWGEWLKNVIFGANQTSSTGIAGNSNVAKAQNNVSSATSARDKAKASLASDKTDLSNTITQSFYSELAALLRSGNASQYEFNLIIERYKKLGVSSLDILRARNLWNSANNKYDSGGVLYGIGGIKATTAPELVIDPELTRRILEPSSNEAFSKFANSLGIIFGDPLKNIASKAAYSNNWQNASTNDNRSYTVNGIPIAKEVAEKYTISELFENMELV